MKGYCPMCLHDHDAKCEIDETIVTWYTHKILREFLEEKQLLHPFMYDFSREDIIPAIIQQWIKELEGDQ